ncbi:NADH-quinone oxidoreductase subunit N [Ravibacter arvi]|uniref:NADH-quinone oxidoreductase subunit N n=1 Tax=Ravibacter arvi TaxID=2051041 RepID=A0ABP8LTR4_9BACT
MYPIILLSVFGMATLFVGLSKSKNLLLPSALLFVIVAFLSGLVDWGEGQLLYFFDMLRVNNVTIAFGFITLLSAFMVMAMSGGFLDDEEAQPAEYFALMIFSLVGALVMIGFENMIMFFIGLEILSIAMYVLAGSEKRNLRSNEAALKYFLMGAFASGILLFGIALLYGATGSFELSGFKSYASANGGQTPLFYAGLFLLLIGMLFKVSAAPFHFWTPDVYEGSPTIFTAFMSTVVKTAGVVAIYRLLSESFASIQGEWWGVLAVITVLTLLTGNITAASQKSFKRMMAYSSISHAGYLLIALTALTEKSSTAIVFYSLAYSLATITAFGVLILVSKVYPLTEDGQPNESFEIFNGLAEKNPLLAFVLTVSMLSLSGIPLTAGFWGKFLVFSTAAERGMVWLLVFAILMAVVGLFYYFRVIIAVYMREGETGKIRVAPFFKILLIGATVATLLFGLVPGLVESVL